MKIGDLIRWTTPPDRRILTVCAVKGAYIQFQDGEYVSGVVLAALFTPVGKGKK